MQIPQIGLFEAMDTALIVLIMSACICGHYKDGIHLPAPLEGNLAHVVKENKHPKRPILPHHTGVYANTGTEYIRNIW